MLTVALVGPAGRGSALDQRGRSSSAVAELPLWAFHSHVWDWQVCQGTRAARLGGLAWWGPLLWGQGWLLEVGALSFESLQGCGDLYEYGGQAYKHPTCEFPGGASEIGAPPRGVTAGCYKCVQQGALHGGGPGKRLPPIKGGVRGNWSADVIEGDPATRSWPQGSQLSFLLAGCPGLFSVAGAC